MRIYVTFGDEKFKKTCDFSTKMAKMIGGFDRVIEYGPEDIDNNFKQKHADIFSISRGYGLWLWKPYLIYKTLVEECKDNDYLFYGDGGSFLIRDIKYIERTMDDGDIWISRNSLVEWQFSKKELFTLMDCEGKEFENTPQAQGGFIYIRKTDKSVNFIKEWLDRCCDIRLLHPDNIVYGTINPKGFQAHREDQSILSLLSKKHNIVFHQDPTQYGKYPEKYWKQGIVKCEYVGGREYPVCILLHRTPDLRWKTIIRQAILILIPRKAGLKIIKYNENSDI